MLQNEKLDVNRSEDRQILIKRLATNKIKAADVEIGAGFRGIVVDLLPNTKKDVLAIVAAGINAGCEIGLSGFRNIDRRVVECGTVEMLKTETLEMATETFIAYVTSRDSCIADFEAGRYDLG